MFPSIDLNPVQTLYTHSLSPSLTLASVFGALTIYLNHSALFIVPCSRLKLATHSLWHFPLRDGIWFLFPSLWADFVASLINRMWWELTQVRSPEALPPLAASRGTLSWNPKLSCRKQVVPWGQHAARSPGQGEGVGRKRGRQADRSRTPSAKLRSEEPSWKWSLQPPLTPCRSEVNHPAEPFLNHWETKFVSNIKCFKLLSLKVIC